jgi:hypothetical protein
MIMAWRDRMGWLNFGICDHGEERQMGDDNGTDMEDTTRYDMSGVPIAWLLKERLVVGFKPPDQE